jgi:di/tricarboxylate transporter
LKSVSITNRPVKDTYSPASQTCVLLGRVLILLTALLVAVMPVTEYLWTFDKFLRGGQDCEFGLLALAAILCMVLVLSHQRRAVLTLVLSLRRVLSFLFQPADPARRAFGLIAPLQYNLPRCASLLNINLPLQI